MSARVLIVDDQPDVLHTLMRFLAVGGYDPIGTTDFNEAKEFIEAQRPDALVTDVRLGAYNGLQLALHMRAVRPDAGIIVLSAWDDPLLRQEAVSIGAQYHMKPIARDRLMGALREVIGEPQSAK
jgi:two-component system response regulator MprA